MPCTMWPTAPVTFHGVARDAARPLVPLFEGWTVASISQLPSVQRDRVDVVAAVEPVFHGEESFSGKSVATSSCPTSCPQMMSRGLSATWVHQLIDVLPRQSVASDGSPGGGCNFEVVGEHVGCKTNLQPRSIRRLLVLCQKFLRGGSGRLDVSPVFAAANVVLLQFRTVVVYGFVKIIAPAQDATFMHDKPDHRRDIAVSKGVRPGSSQSVRVDSAMSIALALSVLCMSLRSQDAHLQVATLLQVQDV